MPAYADGAGIEWDILNQEVVDLYRQGEYARAVVVAKEALDVAVENVGWQHPDVATSLNNLANLYYKLGNYAKVEPLVKRALGICRDGRHRSIHRRKGSDGFLSPLWRV